jgi:DNA-binding transcriptional LysR family regulator
MDIQTLENFLKVAESLNFTRASETAFIAQPALSRQIMLLERTLGADLFHKNKRKVELTEAGVFFRDEIQKLLHQFQETCRRTVQINNGEAGEIRIGYTNRNANLSSGVYQANSPATS